MECRECHTQLDRPGDYCLVCHSRNTEIVVVDVEDAMATLSMLFEGAVIGETTVTTTPESGEEERRQERNYVGRIADEIHRKRPDTVYGTGDRSVIRALRSMLHHELRRIRESDDPVDAVIDQAGQRQMEVVDSDPAEKIGGAHSTIVGGRGGQAALTEVATHPNVKKVVPGPIESGGSRPGGGVRAKATRADMNGNVRLLLRDGSSVQENRVVTTAMDQRGGEQIRADLNEALAETGFQE